MPQAMKCPNNKGTYTYIYTNDSLLQVLHLIFVDPCILVQFIKKNPSKCNNLSKFYYSIFIWNSTCFWRNTGHGQELKTALAASGFSYVEGCWTCSWWTTSTSYTSNSVIFLDFSLWKFLHLLRNPHMDIYKYLSASLCC